MNALDLKNIVWKSEYNIGNFKIDNEHQRLFQIAKKAMIMAGKDDKNISEDLKVILKSLFEYVAIHFKNEEAHMQSINYPDIQRHKELHKNMTTMLTKFLAEINTLKQDEIQKRVFNFIHEYFVNHIISEDKRIKLHEIPLEELRESFGWKEIYKVEHITIDNEHQQLFEIASKAFESVGSENINEKIRSILSDLYDFMKKHFAHEEAYMLEIGYPRLNEHKEIHQKIIHNLNAYVKKLPSMDVGSFEKELAKLIDITLVQHIIQEDRKITLWKRQNK